MTETRWAIMPSSWGGPEVCRIGKITAKTTVVFYAYRNSETRVHNLPLTIFDTEAEAEAVLAEYEKIKAHRANAEEAAQEIINTIRDERSQLIAAFWDGIKGARND